MRVAHLRRRLGNATRPLVGEIGEEVHPPIARTQHAHADPDRPLVLVEIDWGLSDEHNDSQGDEHGDDRTSEFGHRYSPGAMMPLNSAAFIARL
jgi:hypothetical protein